jgi:hypothetical protein
MIALCLGIVCSHSTTLPQVSPNAKRSDRMKRESQRRRMEKQREEVNENNSEQQIVLNYYDRAFASCPSSCNLINFIAGP